MNKKLASLLLVVAMLFSMVAALTGCAGKDAVAPQIRISETSNEWEVSYDEGSTWISLGVKATGAAGAAGTNGTDGVNGVDGKDGADGKDGINGVDGKDGVNGVDGVNGADGKDGVNGVDGKDGATPTIGEDGYWYINGENTGIYAGKTDKVTVTFKELDSEAKFEIAAGSKVNYYVPNSPIATFENWYSDEACTKAFNFNAKIEEDTVIYSKWILDETFATVAALTKSTSFSNASCFGTTACFGSVYVRVLADDHKYYNGAAGIANYLKNVFVETDGVVSVNMSSSLGRISYTNAMTVINFASAFSSYEQYILRNDKEIPSDIAAQKELAIKYFNTVDNTASGYHKYTGGGGLSFPSMGVAVVALGSLMEQQDTERFETLLKDAYENADAGFWNSGMYLDPFYQLCAHYDWYDVSAKKTALAGLTSLTTANVLSYYGYGINVAEEAPELWEAFVESALSDNALNASEAKAFAYHYAYQLTGGDVWLGVYGSSHSVVDYSIAE